MLEATKITIKPLLVKPLLIEISSPKLNDICIFPSVNLLEEINQQIINISRIYWSFINVQSLSHACTDA